MKKIMVFVLLFALIMPAIAHAQPGPEDCLPTTEVIDDLTNAIGVTEFIEVQRKLSLLIAACNNGFIESESGRTVHPITIEPGGQYLITLETDGTSANINMPGIGEDCNGMGTQLAEFLLSGEIGTAQWVLSTFDSTCERLLIEADINASWTLSLEPLQ